MTGDLKKTDLWTQSRQNLEEAIEEEKENSSHKWNPDLLSQEQRLEQRLDKLKLDMFIMGSDGACQVCPAVSLCHATSTGQLPEGVGACSMYDI